MEWGWPDEALRLLTGMPVERFYLRDLSVSQITKIVTEADKKHWIMSPGTTKSREGISGSHAYTLLGVYDLKHNGKTTETLFKIRNPYAWERYYGPWSDKDHHRWTAEYLRQVDHKKDL
jgi:hypothetical protein